MDPGGGSSDVEDEHRHYAATDRRDRGSGFSGTMVAVHLASREPRAARVLLFERDSRMARGPAYGTVIAEHLLNVPARLMSAFPDQPDHFLGWIRHATPRRTPGPSCPGAFTATTWKNCSAKRSIGRDRRWPRFAPRSWTWKRSIDGGFTLLSGTGERFRADVVVLAARQPRTARPDRGPVGSTHAGGVSRQPPAGGSTGGLDRADSIVLIGSGLTAVDLVVEAESRRTVGMITAISRHGLLPQCHAPAAPLAVADSWTASERVGFHHASCSSRSASAVREVEGEGGNWRSVIDALRPGIPELWVCVRCPRRRDSSATLPPSGTSTGIGLAPEIDESSDVPDPRDDYG